MASMTIRSPPCPETTLPFRSRDAAMTGAHVGEDSAAICALTPFTPEYPYAAPCLA